MNWKKTLAHFFSASSSIIQLGITGVLLLITLGLALSTFSLVRTAHQADDYSGIGWVCCLPFTLIAGFFLLISTVWALGGLRQFLFDIGDEEKKKPA